jgi:hypothetical protein
MPQQCTFPRPAQRWFRCCSIDPPFCTFYFGCKNVDMRPDLHTKKIYQHSRILKVSSLQIRIRFSPSSKIKNLSSEVLLIHYSLITQNTFTQRQHTFHSMLQFLSVVLLAQCLVLAWSGLLIDENFTTLDPFKWSIDIVGISAHVSLVPTQYLPVNSTSPNMLFHNVSYCETELCYRAEVKTVPELRRDVIPFNTDSKIWVSFSILLSEDSALYPTQRSVHNI